MPPSGYSTIQATFIDDFLRSCASALERESAALGESLEESLMREIADIQRYMQSTHTLQEVQKDVLMLTKHFYEAVFGFRPSDSATYWRAVESTARSISKHILAIHIPAVERA